MLAPRPPYRPGSFCELVNTFRVSKGQDFTHTSMHKPIGSFYVPPDRFEEFMAVYEDAVTAREGLFMTERHRDISPFLIDLDFRFNQDPPCLDRRYNAVTVAGVVRLYAEKICALVEYTGPYSVFVLEKPSPVLDKGVVKDGLHIVIPEIVTRPSVQYIVRQQVLKEVGPFLEMMGLTNTLHDVIDEAVIERNNWQMFGSQKPTSTKYAVTSVFTVVREEGGELTVSSGPVQDDRSLSSRLSIRNKWTETVIRESARAQVETFEREHSQKKRKKAMVKCNDTPNVCENVEFVAKLVRCLSVERSNTYGEWIRVGWCLRNIDHRLLDAWDTFSRQSPKYTDDGECQEQWNKMKANGLGLGTLHMWAKSDNPVMYKKILETDITALIMKSKNGTHYDIVSVVKAVFRYEFVCVSVKSNLWYEFKDHRWYECDTAYSLCMLLSTTIADEYYKAAIYYNSLAIEAATEGGEHDDKHLDTSKKLTTIVTKLKNNGFKKNLIAESTGRFYQRNFEEKLDTLVSLIGFENGVYDLETHEFREGRPEDSIIFSTKNNYVAYDEFGDIAMEINEFLSQLFLNDAVKKYVLLLLASFLDGNMREEKFYIWTGTGANGKSKLIELFEMAFGMYCCKLPITLLTQKRAASNAATSEIALTKGKRFAVMQEPNEGEHLNLGLMKELTGGDKIIARRLYKEPIEFKPQFKMILTCNHLPHIPSDDGGTWRRIRVVEFTSKFVDVPNPENPNEFLINKEVVQRFDDWKETFISMLIEYHKVYMRDGIREPDEVMKVTRQYQRNNDLVLDFIGEEITTSVSGYIASNECFQRFGAWCKDNHPELLKGVISKKTFVESMERTLGDHSDYSKIKGWSGWSYKADLVDGHDTD